MVLVYSERNSPRLEYTLQLIFRDILGSSVQMTHDLTFFRKSPHPKLSYGEHPTGDELFLKAAPFLFETGYKMPDILSIDFEGIRGFFPASVNSFLPFDPFASAFFVVSRIEEYQPGHRDRHGRFPAGESLLFRFGLTDKAMVNRWAGMIAARLETRYGKGLFPPPVFSFLSTIDIDNAWAYLHKGFFRTTGGALKELLKADFKGLEERFDTICRGYQDPYDTYDFLQRIFKGNEENVKFFFLSGDYGKFDKAVSWKNRHFRDLISEISQKFQVGMHPSHMSGLSHSIDLIVKEKERLEKIICQPVTASRQHYLLLSFPETYRKLIKAGISEDFSMGWSDLPGFRAGICTPYYFYDLETEQSTSLKIYPFQVMDVTLAQYLGLNPEQAAQKIDSLINEVKSVGGLFCSIWHNESLCERRIWKGYREVFEKMNEKGFRYAGCK